jgi:hypothetical protein
VRCFIVPLGSRGLAHCENWNYAIFTTAKEYQHGVNHAECLACHKPLSNVSYTFTLKPLSAAQFIWDIASPDRIVIVVELCRIHLGEPATGHAIQQGRGF